MNRLLPAVGALVVVPALGIGGVIAATNSPAQVIPSPTTIPVAIGDCDARGVFANLDNEGKTLSIIFLFDCQESSESVDQYTWTVDATDEAEVAVLVDALQLLGVVDDGDGEFVPH